MTRTEKGPLGRSNQKKKKKKEKGFRFTRLQLVEKDQSEWMDDE
jgi:hypothetical protein